MSDEETRSNFDVACKRLARLVGKGVLLPSALAASLAALSAASFGGMPSFILFNLQVSASQEEELLNALRPKDLVSVKEATCKPTNWSNFGVLLYNFRQPCGGRRSVEDGQVHWYWSFAMLLASDRSSGVHQGNTIGKSLEARSKTKIKLKSRSNPAQEQSRPMEHFSSEFIGPLPKASGYDMILSITYWLSSSVRVILVFQSDSAPPVCILALNFGGTSFYDRR
ncbi:hypothetical protein CROQUDRAFT_93704 [Cronartium quercuum f. sp. fusiforme G11]|uniref:Uncharacterized protein n=1 Tax=Cronartium quercuum f. sp. fusiforme G11 TaxID=708437 RepID=A0A9P6TBF0_9BASI|nr:hypothetical protein CROQUDRAFT_93704 [Cronartium quercuum f. sp. fusiforme G11]